MKVLRGHSGPVKSVCWTMDDTAIVSAGQEGFIQVAHLRAPLTISAG